MVVMEKVDLEFTIGRGRRDILQLTNEVFPTNTSIGFGLAVNFLFPLKESVLIKQCTQQVHRSNEITIRMY